MSFDRLAEYSFQHVCRLEKRNIVYYECFYVERGTGMEEKGDLIIVMTTTTFRICCFGFLFMTFILIDRPPREEGSSSSVAGDKIVMMPLHSYLNHRHILNLAWKQIGKSEQSTTPRMRWNDAAKFSTLGWGIEGDRASGFNENSRKVSICVHYL